MSRITKAPDERRSELIASARKFFYSKGYEKTSIADIVKEVGVAKGLFYYYFDSKMAILEAMIEQIVAQSQTVMHAIVVDESLTILEKWQTAFQTTGAFKTQHKEDIVVLLRVMQSPENIVLRHKLQQASLQASIPEMTRMIEQGVAEGVFEIDGMAVDSAEIAYNIMRSAHDLLVELVLNPDKYPDRSALAQRKMSAIQSGVERVVGAPRGTLPLINDDILSAWFQ